MAATSYKPPKTRMTKAKMSSYMRNVGRSFGYAIPATLKDMNPTVTALFKSTAEQSKDLYQSIKNFDAKSLGFESEDLKGTLSQGLKDLRNNALEDIRTGKWYNKERIDAVNNQMAEDMLGINFDDFGDFDDFNFDDTDLDEQASITEDATKATVEAMDKVGGKVSSAVSTAAVKSADYIVESGRLNTKALYNLNLSGFGQVNKGVAAINGNLQLLVGMAEPLSQHMQNSALFYTKSQEYYNESLNLLKQIAANTSPKSSNSYGTGGSKRKGYMDYITAEGIIDFQSMITDGGKRLKDNAELITSMMSIVPGGEKAIIKMATASPLQFALTTVIGQMFNIKDKRGRSIRNSFEEFNQVLSNFSAGLLGKAKRANFGDIPLLSPLLRTLRDFLLPSNSIVKKPDTGKYEKGKVDWDGMSRKALMDVIPTQLSQILSALTGEPERRFDYNTGKWVKISTVRLNRERDLRKITNNAGGDLFKYVNKSIDNSNMSRSGKKAYKDQIENFLEKVVLSGDDAFLEILSEDFNFEKYGMSKAMGKNLQRRIRAIQKQRGGNLALSSFAGNVYNARNAYSRRNENLYGAEAALFDKSTTGGRQHMSGKLIDMKDDYGFSQNDYLRHILEHVTYISKNLKNLSVVGVKKTGKQRQIKWESMDEITKSNNRVSRMTSSVDRLEDIVDNDIEESVGRAMAPSTGPNYSDAEKKVLAKYGNDPDAIPESEPLRDKILTKRDEYDLVNKGKGFLSNAYGRLKSGKAGGFISRAERDLGLSTERVSKALDEMSMGLTNFIYDKDKGLYALMNTMTLGALDILKGLIPQSVRDLFGAAWGKFKSSDFGQKTFSTLRDIGLSFFGKNVISDKANRNINRTHSEFGQAVNVQGNEIVQDFTPVDYSDISDIALSGLDDDAEGSGLINRYFGRLKRNQYSGGSFWGRYKRGSYNTRANAAGYSKLRRTPRRSRSRRSGGFSGAASTAQDSEAASPDEDEEMSGGVLKDVVLTAGKSLGNKIFNKMKDLFGKNKTEDEKKAVEDTMSKLMEDAGLGKGAIGAGAFIGAGASLLTGAVVGPIAGAAIGAAVGFVSKSETAQKFLFGELDTEKNERAGGLFNKEISNFVQKNLGATAKGAGAGMIAGTFMGSPILGAIVGATAGYVSSSEKAKEAIFGKLDKNGQRQDGGIIPASLIKSLKEKVPFLASGAGLALLLAPGPLIPKIAIGATLGLIVGKDGGKGMREWFFGDPNSQDEEKKGGFLGYMKKNLFTPILGTVDKAFNMITKFIQDKLTQIGRSLFNGIKGILGKLKDSKLGGKVIGAGERLLGTGKGLLKGAVNVIGSPFRAANTALERAALRNGTSFRGEDNQYLTSSQRLKLAAEKGYKYRETGSTLIDQYLKDLNPEEYDQFIADMEAAEKGDVAGNARIESILKNANHTSKLKYGDITHAIRQAKIDRDKWVSDRKAEEERKKSPEYNVTERIPTLIESVLTVATDIRDKIVGRDVFSSGLTDDYIDANERLADKQKRAADIADRKLAETVGSGVETPEFTGYGDDRDLALTEEGANGEDIYDENHELSSSSKIGSQMKKEKNTMLSGFSALGILPTGVSKISDQLDEMNKNILGLDTDNKEKKSLFDKIKDALLGEDGLFGGLLSFFTGKPGVGIVGNLLTKYPLFSTILGGLQIGISASGLAFLSGKLDDWIAKHGGNGSGNTKNIDSYEEGHSYLYGENQEGEQVELATDEKGNVKISTTEDGTQVVTSLDGEEIPVDEINGITSTRTENASKRGIRRYLASLAVGKSKSLTEIGVSGVGHVLAGAKQGTLRNKLGQKLVGLSDNMFKFRTNTTGKLLDAITPNSMKKAGVAIGESVEAAEKKLISAAKETKVATFARELAEHIKELIKKIKKVFGSRMDGVLTSQIDDVMEETVPEMSEKVAKKFATEGTEEVAEGAVKQVPVLGWAIAIIDAAWEFEEGWNRAARDFKVTTATTTEKAINGIIEAIISLIGMIPAIGTVATIAGSLLKPFIMDPIIEAMIKKGYMTDLATRRKESENEYKADMAAEKAKYGDNYKEKTYDTWHAEKYYDYTWGEKVVNVFTGKANTSKAKQAAIEQKNQELDNYQQEYNQKASQGVDYLINGGGYSGVVSQLDPRYAKYRVGGRSFAANGCGPASAVMAAGGRMGDAVRVAQKYQTSGGTDAAYFGEMFGRRGMKANYYVASGSLIGDIASGKPTVLMGQDVYNTSKAYSPFGPNNHYVVANGFDRSGNILISDPEQGGVRSYNPGILNNVKLGVSGGASHVIPVNQTLETMTQAGLNSTASTSKGRMFTVPGGPRLYTDENGVTTNLTGGNNSAISSGGVDEGGPMSQIWGYLRSKGLNEYARAGLMGCWTAESNLKPDTLEGNYHFKEDANTIMGDTNLMNEYTRKVWQLHKVGAKGQQGYYGTDGNLYPGYGLAQWTGPRQQKLINFAKENGLDHRSLPGQLDFFWSEYNNKPKLQSSLESADSVEAGTIAALDNYEMYPGWHNKEKGQTQLAKRLSYANDIYSKMTGLPGTMPNGSFSDGDVGDLTDSQVGSQDGKESKTSLGGILSTILNAFTQGFSKLFNGGSEDEESTESSSESSTTSSTGGVTNYSGTDPVSYMESIKDKITYTFGSNDIEHGKGDCSGTVGWAIAKSTGLDVGRSTEAMYNNTKNLKSVWYNNGQTAGTIPAEAKRNDILLFSRPNSDYTVGRPDRVGHVGLYMGDNKYIHIGSGKGPVEAPFKSSSNLIKVSRLIDENGNEINFEEGTTDDYIEAPKTSVNGRQLPRNLQANIFQNNDLYTASGSGLVNYRASRAGNYILHDASRNYYKQSAGYSAVNTDGTSSVSTGSLLTAGRNAISSVSAAARQKNKQASELLPTNVASISKDTKEMNANLEAIAQAMQVIMEKMNSGNGNTTTTPAPNSSEDMSALEQLRKYTESVTTALQ